MSSIPWTAIRRWSLPASTFVLMLATVAPPAAHAEKVPTGLARMTLDAGQLLLEPTAEHEALRLRIQGPDGWSRQIELAAQDAERVDLSDLADGAYSYELRAVTTVAPEVLEAALRARQAGDEATLQALRAAGDLPQPVAPQFGSFRIAAGAVLVAPPEGVGEPVRATASPASTVGEPTLARRDQVILDDLIVDGNLCAGLDCVNGETFGSDRVRLKAVNTRLHFLDTSSASGYPSNDWRLTANDSTVGGANRFSIEDATANRALVTVRAGAPEHSLYIDAQGDLGAGTNSPSKALHLVRGDTPALRLEQDGSATFTPRTWDVGGNEVNFFVRDVTGGDLIPFKVRSGAPTDSLVVANNGDVGVSTVAPQAALHVRRANNTALLLVEDTGNSAQDLMRLVNNGVARFRMEASDSGNEWQFRVGANSFNVSRDSTGGNEFEIANDGTVRMGPGASTVFTLATNGNLTISGVLNSSSDRDAKRDIEPVAKTVLERVSQLPLATWRYKDDATEALHLGPMAQDFAALFGLGADERHLAAQDLAGVALAAIQELHAELDAKRDELRILEDHNASLESRLEALEAAIAPPR